MENWKGKVAVVTGAGGGIGRQLALQLADAGCALALCDIDTEALEDTKQRCASRGVDVTTRVLDVSDREAFFAWADAVVADHGAVHLVFNNAGTTVVGTVANLGVDDLEWLMGINYWGVVYGTKAFLPHIEASGGGHIVNISSVFGFIGMPGQSAYNSAKFAVRGFTEALAMELAIAGSNVQAHSVHPGGIKTDIARKARIGAPEELDRPIEEMHAEFDKAARTSAESAARTILRGVARGKRRILVGFDARIISALQRLFPRGYQWLVERGAKRRGLGQV